MSVKIMKHRSEHLTLEEAKAYDCCKDLTDEEIEKLLETLRTLAEVIYCIVAKPMEDITENEYKMAA